LIPLTGCKACIQEHKPRISGEPPEKGVSRQHSRAFARFPLFARPLVRGALTTGFRLLHPLRRTLNTGC